MWYGNEKICRLPVWLSGLLRKWKLEETMSSYLLNASEIPSDFREPHIHTGYRPVNISTWNCIKYMFVVHNEWGNFWTHFVTFWIWLALLYFKSYQLDFSDPFWYPFLIVWIGGCLFVLGSSIAHGFANKSLAWLHILSMVDYTGITLYAYGLSMAYYFYERPLGVSIFEYKWVFVITYMTLTGFALLMCSLSRFKSGNGYVYRVIGFVPIYIVGASPFLLRVKICIFTGNDCVYETLHLQFLSIFFTVITVLFFITKFPERCFPGKCDYYFQSHQFFHIFVVIKTSIVYYFMPIGASVRRAALEKEYYCMSSVESAIIPFIAVVFLYTILVIIVAIKNASKLKTE